MSEIVPANELNKYSEALRGLDPKDPGKQVLYLKGEDRISETLDCTKKLSPHRQLSQNRRQQQD